MTGGFIGKYFVCGYSAAPNPARTGTTGWLWAIIHGSFFTALCAVIKVMYLRSGTDTNRWRFRQFFKRHLLSR